MKTQDLNQAGTKVYIHPFYQEIDIKLEMFQMLEKINCRIDYENPYVTGK